MNRTVTLRLKKSNLKINATLSAIFSTLSLNPVKTLADITAKSQEASHNVFYIDLIVQDDGSYDLQLKKNPDSFYLKDLAKQGTITQRSLEDYARQTLQKSNALTVEQRVRELKGILKSLHIT